MALPQYDLARLLEAGVHFGHRAHRWNPKMAPFIFEERNGLHVLDLTQTVPMLQAALMAVSDIAAQGGRILFVGTKRQASQPIAQLAQDCAQYYINVRWLGGTLTNWKTISNSIARLKMLDELISDDEGGRTKKEMLKLERERNNLERSLGGIKNMQKPPDMVFVIDIKREALAVAEAKKLKIPLVAIVDSNCDPDGIDYPIPGNDDSARAIALYCELMSQAVLDGLERGASGQAPDLVPKPDTANGTDADEPPAEEAIAQQDAEPAVAPAQAAPQPDMSGVDTQPDSEQTTS